MILDYIHSGGDLRVIVASDNDAKVQAVRDAMQDAFGKATVYGVSSQPANVAAQPVGFAAAHQGANERIASLRRNHGEASEEGSVLVAIENFLLEASNDEWVDMGCLILEDKTRDIRLNVYTQPTVVPTAVITQLREETKDDYPLSWSGFSSTVGAVLSKNLNISPQKWHEVVGGASRSELLALASKSLAHNYKKAIMAKVEKV